MSSQTEASAVNAALEEPVPTMGESEGLIAQLQRGVVDPVTGEWHTAVEVREMNGADEEYLATLENKDNLTYSEYMVSLLKRTVVKVGPIDVSDNPSIIENVSMGDRDIMFMAVIKATYGSERTFITKCPHCNKSNDVTINLNEDFPLREPSMDLRSLIVKPLKNGKVVKLRLPNSSDSSFVGKKATSIAAQNTLMLARCAVWEDGERPVNAEEWARSLSIADRAMLIESLLNVEAGPKMEGVNIQCAGCGENVAIVVDWISLLLS